MKFIVRFLFIILALTNFVFNRIHYLQKIGCTIGAICAPNYANIFMGKFEKTADGLQLLIIFEKCSILDPLVGSKYIL